MISNDDVVTNSGKVAHSDMQNREIGKAAAREEWRSSRVSRWSPRRF
jgi:hypothetical protein